MRLSASLQELPTFINPSEFESDPTIPLKTLRKDGSISTFSKERNSPKSPTKRKNCIMALLFSLLLLSALFLIFLFSRGHFGNFLSKNNSQYYVILDCGSTGTRVYVYEWSVVNSNKKGLPISIKSLPNTPLKNSNSRKSGRAYQRMETEPGFDKLVRNETGLRSAINPLLSWAEKQIPQHAHQSTLLFLYATGGVRKLPGEDSDWILNKAWAILQNSSFSSSRDRVKIINGIEEAYYGWIALNHQKGTLGNPNPKKISSFGSLDLGGSSLQVTFESEKLGLGETPVSLRIGSVTHQLTAYSLSGYGLNDAFDKSVAYLIKKNGLVAQNDNKIQVNHPCLHTGYKEDYTCSYCNNINKKGGVNTLVELIGNPNYEECTSLAKTSVNRSNWDDNNNSTFQGLDCKTSPCALSSNLPKPNGQFYALSGFYVVFKFFNLTPDSSLSDVLQKGRDFCAKPWESAKSSVAPQPFIEQYCFRAPYVISLLREGLQIKDSQVVIGSGSLTWTLGVALLEAGQRLNGLESEVYYNRVLENRDLKAGILVLVFGVLVVCGVVCVRGSRSFRKKLGYLPLFRKSNASGSVRANPFKLHLWSPISSGEKLPLSPTVNGSGPHPFNSSLQLSEFTNNPTVSHSYSAGSLGQMQFAVNNGNYKPMWGQSTLQSRRSQSREDLSASLADLHLPKV
ncbi:hypothetical protein LUZ60_012810 [Juncus effusus]|nr:hypothetical protein LUZ60_012810 [Juncus effusus]